MEMSYACDSLCYDFQRRAHKINKRWQSTQSSMVRCRLIASTAGSIPVGLGVAPCINGSTDFSTENDSAAVAVSTSRLDGRDPNGSGEVRSG